MITDIVKTTGGWLFHTNDTGDGSLLAYNIDDVQLPQSGIPGQPYFVKDSQISEIDQVYRTSPEPPYIFFIPSNLSGILRESEVLKNAIIINFMQIQDADENEKIEYWFYNNNNLVKKVNHEFGKYYQVLDLTTDLNTFENIITQQTVIDGIKGNIINLGVIYKVKNPPQNPFKILKKNDTAKTITIRVS